MKRITCKPHGFLWRALLVGFSFPQPRAHAQQCFESYSVSGTGFEPVFIAQADFNGDGLIDLAVPNANSSSVSVLINTGTGTFMPHVSYSTGTSPRTVATGDFDGDSDIDLAVANSGSSYISILLNNGNGSFSTPATLPIGSFGPYSISPADLDADGDVDLAVGAGCNCITILLNQGNGTFAVHSSFIQYYPYSLNAIDMNADGLPDLVMVNTFYSNTVTIRYAIGVAQYGPGFTFGLPSASEWLVATDLDGDSDVDLAAACVATVSGGPGSVAVFLNTGPGFLAGPVSYSISGSPVGIDAVDLDGDGDKDLVTGLEHVAELRVLTNDGSGGFGSQQNLNIAALPWAVIGTDIDIDGDMDLAVAERYANQVQVLRNCRISGRPFCSGDGSGSPCPCGNNGTVGRGCANSNVGSQGALLTATGAASIASDSLILNGTDLTGPGLFFNASGLGGPSSFGDGLLCASVGIVRMGVVFPTGNTASYPGGSTPNPVHLAGGVGSPGSSYVQCWYRDAAAFCTSATYNLSNGLNILWAP